MVEFVEAKVRELDNAVNRAKTDMAVRGSALCRVALCRAWWCAQWVSPVCCSQAQVQLQQQARPHAFADDVQHSLRRKVDKTEMTAALHKLVGLVGLLWSCVVGEVEHRACVVSRECH